MSVLMARSEGVYEYSVEAVANMEGRGNVLAFVSRREPEELFRGMYTEGQEEARREQQRKKKMSDGARRIENPSLRRQAGRKCP